MEHDFIVGFTLFTSKGFKTMHRHFSNLEHAKLFASNVNIKNNCKIYVDLDYFERNMEKIEKDYISKSKAKEKIEELKNECKKCCYNHIFCENQKPLVNSTKYCLTLKAVPILQELLED